MSIVLFNDTPFPAFGFDFEVYEPIEWYCLAVKASFTIDRGRLVPKEAEEQTAITIGDQYYGDPQITSLSASTDLIPRRDRTDILVTGTACSPSGKPEHRWLAELKIGDLYKAAQVTGPRQWKHRAITGWELSHTAPTEKVPLHYELAYGGEFDAPDDEERNVWLPNPIGRGFTGRKRPQTDRVWDAPQILLRDEELSDSLGKKYTTTGFGPIPGDWAPRVNRIGTTDANWQKTVAPHMPKDFDLRFYNVAPDDQQAKGFLKGNEQIALSGLFPAFTQFHLPSYEANALLVDHNDLVIAYPMDLSSVNINLDENSVDLVWRITTISQNWKQVSLSVIEGWH